MAFEGIEKADVTEIKSLKAPPQRASYSRIQTVQNLMKTTEI